MRSFLLSFTTKDKRVKNAVVFAKGLEKCRLLTNLLGRNVEILDVMVARKFKCSSKRTVCGSALVTLSNTKQIFTVPRGKERCMETGLCNICNFFMCLLYLSLLLIQFFHLDMIFL